MKNICKYLSVLASCVCMPLCSEPRVCHKPYMGPTKWRLDTEQQKLVEQALAELSHHIYLQLSADSDTSVCFSPASLTTVLGMWLHALPQEEQAACLQLLQLDNLKAIQIQYAIHDRLQRLQLDGQDQPCTIRLTNALAAAASVPSAYQKALSSLYRAETFTISQDKETACQELNAWVDANTAHLIPHLLAAEDFPEDPLLAVLLNALYFKASWQNPFNKAMPGTFTLPDGQQITTSMLTSHQTLPYYSTPDFSMVEIPYVAPSGRNLAYVLFIPQAHQSLADLEVQLTPQFIRECRQQATPTYLAFTMPSLKAEVKYNQLKDTLQKLGWPMDSYLPALDPKAQLGALVHKAVLTVDAKGTEGAAATAGIITKTSCPSSVVSVKADHSYSYLILAEDTVLFQGNVRDASVLVP